MNGFEYMAAHPQMTIGLHVWWGVVLIAVTAALRGRS